MSDILEFPSGVRRKMPLREIFRVVSEYGDSAGKSPHRAAMDQDLSAKIEHQADCLRFLAQQCGPHTQTAQEITAFASRLETMAAQIVSEHHHEEI